MGVENVIAPAISAELLDFISGLHSLLVPKLDDRARSVSVFEYTLARLCDTNSGVKVWVVLGGESCGDGLEESHKVVGVGDASGAQALAGVQQLAVRGVEEVCKSRGELLLHRLAQDRAEDGLDDPCEPAEAALAQLVVHLVDVYAHGFEGEDLLEALLADLDVDVNVNAAVVQRERGDSLVRHA